MKKKEFHRQYNKIKYLDKLNKIYFFLDLKRNSSFEINESPKYFKVNF
jgi:hypothetical protein